MSVRTTWLASKFPRLLLRFHQEKSRLSIPKAHPIKVLMPEVKYQRDIVSFRWKVSENLPREFIQICLVLQVKFLLFVISASLDELCIMAFKFPLLNCISTAIFVGLGHLELRELTTSRFGLSSSIYVNCSGCGLSEFLAKGHHDSSDNAPRTVQGKDVNRRSVYAASEMGIGKEGIAKLCEILNMPFSMSKDTWYTHEAVCMKQYFE